MNTTISLKGIRPSGDSIVIGLYSSIYIDAVLKVNLSNALDGDETNAIDIPQIAERLAFMLKRCEKDSEIEEHPAIALELIAKSVLNSAMHTWQISEADITVHAALRSEYYGMKSTVDDVCVTLNSVSREELNYSERRVVPESLAHAAVRSGSVSVDDLEEGEIADYYRSLIEEDRKEKQRKEDEDAVAAAKAAVDIANSFADDYENNGDSQCSCGDESKSVNYGNELVKRETKSPLFRICPTPLQTTAVISMKGVAKQDTRSAMLRIVAMLEQDRESRVDGVSALYVANMLDADYYAAVFILSSGGDEYELLRLLRAVATLYKDKVTVRVLGTRSYGASAADTRTVDAEKLPQQLAEMVTVDPKAPELMPWMQIESDAALDDNSVSYSLAFAFDAQTVGVYSEQWLIGDGC